MGSEQVNSKKDHVLSTRFGATCTNVVQIRNAPEYPNYGGRGIKVCERWNSFENFYADMGPRPDGCEIDRYPDNDGDYKPSNCRWTTQAGQARNKRNNVHVDVGIESVVKSEAAKRSGINISTFHGRIERGWSGDEASTPAVPRPKLNFEPGTLFGHLTIIKAVGRKSKSNHVYYEVKCTCGDTATVKGSHIKNGQMKYCSLSCSDRTRRGDATKRNAVRKLTRKKT